MVYEQYITLNIGSIGNAFFAEDVPEKEDITYSEFLTSIGITTSCVTQSLAVYRIIDEKKWLFAKLKYGI